LLLDEPANGLDPAGIIEIREMFKTLSENSITVFISSHILAELARIDTKIGIIHRTRLIKELKTAELEKQRTKKLIIVNSNHNKTLLFLQKKNISSNINHDNVIESADKEAINNPAMICEWLVKEKLTPKTFYIFQEDLESFFIRMIQNKES